MIKGVNHIGVSTGDLDRLCQFYCDVLGFELVVSGGWEPGTEISDQVERMVGLKNTAAKVAMVIKGGLIIEMFEYRSPTPKPIAHDWQVCDHGYNHICLEVEDIRAEYERLRKAGMTFYSPPPTEAYNGMKAVFGRDPEGHVIELMEFSSNASN